VGAKESARDAAQRYLSTEQQQALKTLVGGFIGPRRPSRFKSAPTELSAAARHFVQVAHATRRVADYRRARLAFGDWTIHQPGWRVPTTPQNRGSSITLGLVGPGATSRPDAELVLGISGARAALCDMVLLPHAEQALAALGAHERAAVLVAAAAAPLADRGVTQVTTVPADDPVLLAIARSLSPQEHPDVH
jgi:hypothetical protein